jgi:hypothetical protein
MKTLADFSVLGTNLSVRNFVTVRSDRYSTMVDFIYSLDHLQFVTLGN